MSFQSLLGIKMIIVIAFYIHSLLFAKIIYFFKNGIILRCPTNIYTYFQISMVYQRGKFS